MRQFLCLLLALAVLTGNIGVVQAKQAVLIHQYSKQQFHSL